MKDPKHSFIKFWKTGKLQRTSRITYDVVWNIILAFIMVGIVAGFFVMGAGAGYFASLVKDEPIHSYASMKKDIYNYEETSKLYFADNKYIGDVRSDLHRDNIKLDKVSDKLIHAVIATEDANFYKHKGVVPKSIIRAVIQEALNSDVKTGGSTLTQQLIKNQILTNEVSFERKAKEILLSLRLERFFSKDQILEAYLNVIPYGRNASGKSIAGIQTAAKGVFGVDAKDLNLAQSAYLAGLPQSPSFYTPFTAKGKQKDKADIKPSINRMKEILKRMYNLDYISKEDYQKALDYDIKGDFTKAKDSSHKKYPYLTDEIEQRATDIIAKKLAKADGHKQKELQKNNDLKNKYKKKADHDLRRKGYRIHSTIDKKTYKAFQKIVKNYDTYGPDKPIQDKDGNDTKDMDPVQVGGMLVENSTGKIISFIGGRDYKKSEVNHIRAKRPNGSTMKPLLVYGPAIEKGIVQPSSPILDYKFNIGKWSPNNYAGGYHGIVSTRQALAQSYNIPAVKTYKKILSDDPAKNYLNKMGITSLTKADHVNPSLSLGQPTNGIPIQENISAFSTFGNEGKFQKGYMIESITDNKGDVIYKHTQKDPKHVFSKQANYLTVDMMRDVIKNGTASYLNSQLNHPNVDWAGKTGTSQYFQDAWFVGVNPKVTFGTWMGYNQPKSLECKSCSIGYSNRNVRLWAQLVNKAQEINPDLVASEKKFKKPSNIVSKSYCGPSGRLPTELCKKAGLVHSDLFDKKHVPTKKDDSITKKGGKTVKVNGKSVKAGSHTPSEFVTSGSDQLAFSQDFLKREGYDKYDDLSILYPRTNRDKWEKISSSTSNSGDSNAIHDNKKAPGPPTAVSKSGNKLTWSKPKDKAVVGYRIYYAKDSDHSFSKIGSTTDTTGTISSNSGIYIVKTVDYFGRESKGSNEVKIDNKEKSHKHHSDKKHKDQKKEKDKKEKDKEKKKDKDKDHKKDKKNDDD